MKKKILLASLLSIVNFGVTAQSQFQGVYGQVGIGYESIVPSFSSSNLTVVGVGTAPIDASISSANSATGVATIGFMASVNNDFLLGIGVDYSPIVGRKASYSGSVLGTSLGNGTYNKVNSYNIFLSPAIPINSYGLLYGKVGYTGATIKDTFGSYSSNINYTGYSLGLGYKHMITGGLYTFLEGNFMNYGNKTTESSAVIEGYTVTSSITSKASAYNILYGLGYKF